MGGREYCGLGLGHFRGFWQSVRVVLCLRSCLWFSWTGSVEEIKSLLFTYDMALLESSVLQALGWFAVQYDVVGMRLRAFKSKAMGLCWKRVDCSPLPAVHKWWGNGVLDVQEIWYGSSSTVDAAPDCHGWRGSWARGESSLPFHWRSDPHLWPQAVSSDQKNWIADTCGWVSYVGWLGSASEIGWGVQVSIGELRVERLLLRIKRTYLRWFRHLVRMSPWCLSWEVYQAQPTGRRPQAEPEFTGANLYSIWPGNASESPRRSRKALLGRRRSRIPF